MLDFGDSLRFLSGAVTLGATELLGVGGAIEGAGDELSGKASRKRIEARQATIRREKAEAQMKRNEAVSKSYRQRRQAQGVVGGAGDVSNLLQSLGASSTTEESLLTKDI